MFAFGSKDKVFFKYNSHDPKANPKENVMELRVPEKASLLNFLRHLISRMGYSFELKSIENPEDESSLSPGRLSILVYPPSISSIIVFKQG